MPVLATPISAASFAALPTRLQLRRVERLAREALPLYGLPHDSKVSLLNYSENATFLITPADGPRRVLRINRPGYHPRAHLVSELLWVDALRRDTDLMVAAAVPGIDGECIQHIWHPDVPEPRHCILMEFLPGREPDEENRVEAFALLGTVTGKLHQHASTWRPARPLQRHAWNWESTVGPDALWGKWERGLGMTPAKTALLNRALEKIKPIIHGLGSGRSRFGLIHADLRAANLLVTRSDVAVIDFDDCGFGWYIYDLAAALSFIEDHPRLNEFIAAWLEGYRKVRALSRPEVQAIDAFVLLRRIQLVAWVGTHTDTAQGQAMGAPFTDGACELAERFLTHSRIRV